jgi:hypothetical protein
MEFVFLVSFFRLFGYGKIVPFFVFSWRRLTAVRSGKSVDNSCAQPWGLVDVWTYCTGERFGSCGVWFVHVVECFVTQKIILFPSQTHPTAWFCHPNLDFGHETRARYTFACKSSRGVNNITAYICNECVRA